MSLGEKINQLRKSKGISQELLAENSHVSLRTIQRIERGESIPRLFTLKVIAEALGTDVEQLTALMEPSAAADKNGTSILLRINLSSLVGLLIPFANIVVPLFVWRKHNDQANVRDMGSRIVSFQILWTVATVILLICTRLFVVGPTRSVAIGHLPPTILLVYLVLLIVNLVFVLGAAIQLRKNAHSIYSSIPSLF